MISFLVTVQRDPGPDPYRSTGMMDELSACIDQDSPTAHLSERPYDTTGALQNIINDLTQQSLSQNYLQGNVRSPNMSITPRANPTELPDNQSQFRTSLQGKNTDVMISDHSRPNPPSAEFQPSEENHDDANDCPRFSVQSFEPQGKGLSRDIIVTVGMREEEDFSQTDFTADTFSPSRSTRPPFQSTTSLIDADLDLDDPSDGISEYWSSYGMSNITSRRGSQYFSIGSEINRGLFPQVSAH